jgi:hypothetical protein
MTDIEMTKLCMEAMGLTNDYPIELHRKPARQDGSHFSVYDPLNFDSQAMALLKEFNLTVYSELENPKTWTVDFYYSLERNASESGESKDLNRAIVECVSKIQAAKMKAA